MSTLKHPIALPTNSEITALRTLAERAYLSLRHDVVCGKLAPVEALSLLVSDALVTAEGQRGFRVAPISLTDLEDVTNTRVMLETEALRQSIRHGDAQWEAALVASYELLTQTEIDPAGPDPDLWERRNKAFHAALNAGFNSNWSKYFLDILYRHAERYRNINWRLTHDIGKRQSQLA